LTTFRTFLAALAVAAAPVAVHAFAPSEPVQQLRIYKLFDTNRDAFHVRFRDHALRIMARYGFDIEAIWETRNDEGPQFVYLLNWPDEATMRRAWQGFMTDEEWIRIKQESAASHGPMVADIEERVLRPTDYSPPLGEQRGFAAGRIAPFERPVSLHDRIEAARDEPVGKGEAAMLALAHLLNAVALAAQASSSSAVGRPVISTAIFATVGHSEWCPAGTVYLDLRTGRYALMPPAERRVCDSADLERRVEQDTLRDDQLGAIRTAHEAVQVEGLIQPACRAGLGPPNIVVRNGGRVTMVLSGPVRTEAAPDDLGCWTAAADRLHRVMQQIFTPEYAPGQVAE